MQKHKKLLFIWTLLTVFIVMGCTVNPKSNNTLSNSTSTNPTTNITSDSTSNTPNLVDVTIFSINDLHGALEETSNTGFSYISGYLKKERETKRNVAFISNGDALQGSALSNINKGATVIEALNLAQLDAFNIGNHEFDWGLNTIKSYFDSNIESNIKANYPVLGANIYEKSTNARPEWIKPYTIINKEDVSIGLIGVIGTGLENSIAKVMVDPYEFVYPIPLIKQYASHLRDVEKVDLVVLATHSSTKTFDKEIATFSGSERIDALFNAHTHLVETSLISRDNYPDLPVIQAGSSGNNIAKVSLIYDTNNKKLISSALSNIYIPSVYTKITKDEVITSYLNSEVELISPIINQKLGLAGEYIQKSEGTKWAADLIKAYTNADIGFVNTAGIREGFPIYKDDEITYKLIYSISPFDNYIKTTYLTGKNIKNYVNSAGAITFDRQYSSANFEDNKLYKIATVDYVFDKELLFTQVGVNSEITTLLLREIMKEDILYATKDNAKWYASLGAANKNH